MPETCKAILTVSGQLANPLLTGRYCLSLLHWSNIDGDFAVNHVNMSGSFLYGRDCSARNLYLHANTENKIPHFFSLFFVNFFFFYQL